MVDQSQQRCLRPRRPTVRSSSANIRSDREEPAPASPLLPRSPPPSSPCPRVSSIVNFSVARRVSRDQVVSTIERHLEAVLDGTAHSDRPLFLPYRSRAAGSGQDLQSQQNLPGPNDRSEGVRFPGRNASESKQFGKKLARKLARRVLTLSTVRVLRILELCHQALTSGDIITKR